MASSSERLRGQRHHSQEACFGLAFEEEEEERDLIFIQSQLHKVHVCCVPLLVWRHGLSLRRRLASKDVWCIVYTVRVLLVFRNAISE